jgi:uncharacterized alkaline shock family protein YloU
VSPDGFSVTNAEGTVSISSAALGRAVASAAETVDGVRVRRPRRGIDLAISGGRARVSLVLAARQGVVLQDAARNVQERVAAALEATIGLGSTVDVTVEEIL